MSVMIERVARAMAPTAWRDFDVKTHGSPANQRAAQAMWLSHARAAINAMREPTPQMVAQTCVWTADPTAAQTAAGLEAMVAMSETNPLGLQAACEVVRDWQTMIDQALVP